MLQIEKNIKMPEKQYGRPRKYPFYDMEIGDSVFVEGRKITDMGSILTNVKGKTFSRRTVKENGKNVGVRVWRIS